MGNCTFLVYIISGIYIQHLYTTLEHDTALSFELPHDCYIYVHHNYLNTVVYSVTSL